MTLSEYMDPGHFPLTTQRGLSPKNQLLIDSFNYDQGREAVESGEQFTAEDQARWAELRAKMAEQPRLLREPREAEKAEGRPR
jgi:hypothetical protein